jgi:S-methylmethionine-dependent homocysteine/selenocysteine methylase
MKGTHPFIFAKGTHPFIFKKKGPPKRAFRELALDRLPATAAATATATATAAGAVATAAATAAGAEATAAARTATTAAATGAAGTILRFIDAQLTATHREAIQRLDGLGCLSLGHLDEAEAARAAGFAIRRQRYGLNRAVLREQVTHLGLSR